MTDAAQLTIIEMWAKTYIKHAQFQDPGAEEGAVMAITALKKVIAFQKETIGASK